MFEASAVSKITCKFMEEVLKTRLITMRSQPNCFEVVLRLFCFVVIVLFVVLVVVVVVDVVDVVFVVVVVVDVVV